MSGCQHAPSTWQQSCLLGCLGAQQAPRAQTRVRDAACSAWRRGGGAAPRTGRRRGDRERVGDQPEDGLLVGQAQHGRRARAGRAGDHRRGACRARVSARARPRARDCAAGAGAPKLKGRQRPLATDAAVAAVRARRAPHRCADGRKSPDRVPIYRHIGAVAAPQTASLCRDS